MDVSTNSFFEEDRSPNSDLASYDLVGRFTSDDCAPRKLLAAIGTLHISVSVVLNTRLID